MPTGNALNLKLVNCCLKVSIADPVAVESRICVLNTLLEEGGTAGPGAEGV